MANMHIKPIYRETANKKHWVVRWLRGIGVFICILGAVFGIIAGSQYARALLNRYSYDAEVALTYALGGIIGLLAGLAVSLPYWALSLLLDDIHALRIYASGYVTDGEDKTGAAE